MNDWKKLVLSRAAELEEQSAAIAQWIFDHPELGFEERQSSRKLQDYLSEHGFRVEGGVAGMPTAFRAEYSNGQGPVIGFVCEYDALPGLGHACGHNIIGASSATAAIAAAAAVKQGLKGKIVVLGSPCEEGRGGGKQVLMENGFMDDLDCALMFHPGFKTILSEPTMAVSLRKYIFHGKEARSAMPEQGRSALDAVVQMVVSVNALRHYLEKDCSVHGVITNGGTSAGIIPALCEAQYSLRALSIAHMEDMAARVSDCARAAALATGCTVEIEEVGRTYEEMWPSRVLVDVIEQNMKELGLPVDLTYTDVAPMAATDMGNVSHKIPGVHCMYALGHPATQHSPEFAAACTGENGRRLTNSIAQSLALTAVDLLAAPELLEKAKKELAGRTGY